MAECKECGKSIKAWEALGGACEDCYSLHLQNKARLKQKEGAAESHLRRKEDEAETELAKLELDAIILTTETAPNLNIKSRVGIIMADADCSFTIKMVENNNALQFKLRSEAYSIGANAVVGITFNMIETYSATLGVNTFKLIAYGTAVIIENEEGAL